MNTRSFIFFTRILARAQISSLTSEGAFIEVLSVTILETTKTIDFLDISLAMFYRSQFWRLQKLSVSLISLRLCFIGHNFGDYKNHPLWWGTPWPVLSVTILETTKTCQEIITNLTLFYRSQFWRLQKPQMVSANYTIKVRSYSESPHFTK